MSLSERGISPSLKRSRLGEVRESLSDHTYKTICTLGAIAINTFVDFTSTKPIHEQVFYLGFMAGVGALADIVARGDRRLAASTQIN